MRGSIRRRGKSWQLRAYAGRDPVSARKRWVTRTVSGTRRDAERALSVLVSQVDSGALDAATLVATLLERWYEHASPDWSPRTLVQHRHVLDRYLVPRFGSTALSKLEPADIDRFYAGLRRGPEPRLAPATIRRIHGVLRSALAQGVKWGWLAANPADRATPPRVVPSSIQPPSLKDLRRVVVRIEHDDDEFFVFIRLAVVTGARRSQLLGIQWHDIDLRSGSIVFQRGIVDGPTGIVIKDTKTHRAYRVVLDDVSLGVLQRHRARAETRARTGGVVIPSSGFAFSSDIDGRRPWRPDSVTHRWRRFCRSAGLPGIRLHDLRHFAATAMLGAGVPVNVVAGRLGHARAATTLNVYAHFTQAGDQAAADAVGALLDGPPGSHRRTRQERAAGLPRDRDE